MQRRVQRAVLTWRGQSYSSLPLIVSNLNVVLVSYSFSVANPTVERFVIITGDNVIIKGWEGPGIRCVTEKIIVAKEQPGDAEFDAIQVKHELGTAEDLIGLTSEQRDKQEEEYVRSEAGRKLSEEQKSRRKNVVDRIHSSYDKYLAFQVRECNIIQLSGLTHDEGNRNLTLRINSPDGSRTLSSQWQRHATMTVYLPACKSVAVRGCLVGLDIQDVECDLVLTADGSRDRDYQGFFEVSGVKGSVKIDQVSVRRLPEVTGNVNISATNEFVNSGTHHENDTRTFATYKTHTTDINHISGDLKAVFLRTELRLNAIGGMIDVIN